MSNKKVFSCYLIGSGSILVKCAEVLLKSSFVIEGIVSSDSIVQQWAKNNKLTYLNNCRQLQKLLEIEKCDYLFSIANHTILSPVLLDLVKQKAINYHDALLPSYAGVNATAWAIINGKTKHGITWHEVTPEIDTGNILKQVTIEISPSDTTLVLNSKCYQAAIASFAELISELASNKIDSLPQNLTRRSYVARHQKPTNFGIIDFQQSAAQINCVVRGLNFGNYANGLASAKLLLNSSSGLDYLVVCGAEQLTVKSPQAPGTIVRILQDRIAIATTTTDIALFNFISKQGQAIAISVLVTSYQLEIGQQLPVVSARLSSEIVNLATERSPVEKYWCRQLSKSQPLLLPGCKKAHLLTTQQNYRRVALPLDEALQQFIEQNYNTYETTEIIVAILAIYLTRLSANQNITFGWEISTAEKAIAPWFTTVVPLNLTVALQDNFSTVVKAVRKRLKLNLKKGSYASDLYARYPQLANRAQDFNVIVAYNAISATGQLTLSIEPEGYYLLYNNRAFSPEQIATSIEQWQTLTSSLVHSSNLNCAISELQLTSPSESQWLLSQNPDPTAYPEQLCLHQLFEARAIEDPEAIAVVYRGQSLTRGELNQRANQLARQLQQLGVQPETLVGICLERSLDMAIALYAVLKAGGAYVPLDPNYPAARLSYLLEDARVQILLTQTKLLDRIPATEAQLVCLDLDKIGADLETTNLSVNVHSHNLAYVIYTSGSTGNPKGVAIEHHSAVNTLWDLERRFAVRSEDRILAVSSLSFDLSVYDLFGILGSGGTAILPPTTIVPEPAQWLELIDREKVTIWNSAPALLELLVNYLVAYQRELPRSLRLVMLSGDRINPNLVIELQNLNPQLQIVSLGGATEASIWSICYPVVTSWSPEQAIPYGRPLDNQSFYILDAQQRLAPKGIVGELYIGGVGVARGYLNRPDLTSTKFILDPFSTLPHARMYRTGDLGRYLPDGNIEFLGRIDNQVKIRGVRIELGEVETALLQCPDIQEVLVTVRTSERNQKSLVAYVIFKPNSGLTAKQLRDLLALQLPESAIPATFIFLDAFPLTPNGKVDLKALPLTSSKSTTCDRYLPLQKPLEFQLSQIWSQVLGVPSIARDDDFFSLGGNSLMALRLFERIERIIGISLPLATLFTAPTIAQLAKIIGDRAKNSSILVEIQPQGTKSPLFCIHGIKGSVLGYQSLAKALGCDRPIYGLQARGLTGEALTSISLEEMAVDYLQEIKGRQPKGPYYLSGYSFGGYVAYEIARLLEQQGEIVALLALFDCLGPNYSDKLTPSQKIWIHLNNLQQLSFPQASKYIKDRIEYILREKVPLTIQKKYLTLIKRFLSPQQQLISQITFLNYQIARNYVPQIYTGKITLFRAKIRDSYAADDPNGGWKDLALGGIQSFDIPGDHDNILSQPEIAQILSQQG